jgi:polyisoprenoid-binding protein YceI
MGGPVRAHPLLLLLLVLPLASLGAGAAPATAGLDPLAEPQARSRWRIDTTHSELSFRIRHLVSRVRGTFDEWQGTLLVDPADLAGGSVEVEIRTASISTNHRRRDDHLRSADFFDAESHPTITFRSTRVEVRGEDLRVHGTLTIRGIARPVVLEGRLLEIVGPPGRRRMGFEARTRIDRTHFGVLWNRSAEGGGLVLSDEVTIALAISAVEEREES